MQQSKVRDVMTNQVLTVATDAPPTEVIAVMTSHDVSAVAVADDFDVVLGVLTRTDVLSAMAWRTETPRSRLPWRRRTRPTFFWRRTTARQMMTAPAVTIAPDMTPAQAGRRMREADVNRLLVTDHRQRLLGIVSAGDPLEVLTSSAGDVPLEQMAAARPSATAGT
jgi:CBS domain-containing protein